MRRLNLCVFSLITAGLAAVVPAAADDQLVDVSATARMISMPSPNTAVPSGFNYKGLAETSVIAGLETPGVPCANCVAGASTPNIGAPWPVFAVQRGQTLNISTWFESTAYTGPCTASILLKQNGKPVATGSFPLPNGCGADIRYGIFFTVPVPNGAGLTTVTGMVSGGTNKSGAITLLNVQ